MNGRDREFCLDYWIKIVYNGGVGVIAQLIRALPLQGRGPGFESLLLHHFLCEIMPRIGVFLCEFHTCV